uniref:6-phosphogluconolactonase n=1 Tax=Equus caballus TaxID=9796 RepID=F6RL46_HORSE
PGYGGRRGSFEEERPPPETRQARHAGSHRALCLYLEGSWEWSAGRPEIPPGLHLHCHPSGPVGPWSHTEAPLHQGLCLTAGDAVPPSAQTHLLSRLPIPDGQVITINPQLPVQEAAEDYAQKLRQAFQGDSIPVFDLLILGVGPDGHTCSLFPDHPLLQEREKIVAPISDSPKPPPQRVTLTLPVLNAARTVIFVATGEGKAAVLKRILEDKEENPLPAALVQPHTGKLCWFLDEAAARLLTVPFEKHSAL